MAQSIDNIDKKIEELDVKIKKLEDDNPSNLKTYNYLS